MTAALKSDPRAAQTAGGLVQGHWRAPNMNGNSTRLDVQELTTAANLIRNIAIRRFEQGFNVEFLNELANATLRCMHYVATEPTPTKGRKMEDDDTPPNTAELAVLKNPTRPPPNLNPFKVGKLEDTVTILQLTPRRLTHDEALNLAANLLAVADEPVAFEHANVYGVVISLEFVELMQKLQAGK